MAKGQKPKQPPKPPKGGFPPKGGTKMPYPPK